MNSMDASNVSDNGSELKAGLKKHYMFHDRGVKVLQQLPPRTNARNITQPSQDKSIRFGKSTGQLREIQTPMTNNLSKGYCDLKRKQTRMGHVTVHKAKNRNSSGTTHAHKVKRN